MQLTPAMQAFILHWGEMGSKWGTNRSVAQVHALLHLSPRPLPADEIAETLGIARSNVSMAVKELSAWKLIRVSRELGDRRDHFEAIRDMFDLVQTVIQGRHQREYAPTLEEVRGVLAAAEGDGETLPDVVARIRETKEAMEMFDRFYREIARLPRGTQVALLKAGARLARLLPGAG